jgi:cell division septation protein DedD
LAQDDYYYEIQLTNKQLVFYFMAGASGLILSFLAGIMVGRGVDATPEVQAASAGRPAFEDRITREEPPPSSPAAKAAAQPEEMTYSRVLEAEKTEAAPAPVPDTKAKGTFTVPVTTLPPTTSRVRTVDPATAKPSVATTTTASVPAAAEPTGKSYTIQVGAFSQKGYADSQVSTLKKKGYAAYVVSPDGGDSLFNVRVGPYTTRASAENVQKQLASEKLKPFIVERQ